jgi:hypothetical protein
MFVPTFQRLIWFFRQEGYFCEKIAGPRLPAIQRNKLVLGNSPGYKLLGFAGLFF